MIVLFYYPIRKINIAKIMHIINNWIKILLIKENIQRKLIVILEKYIC